MNKGLYLQQMPASIPNNVHVCAQMQLPRALLILKVKRNDTAVSHSLGQTGRTKIFPTPTPLQLNMFRKKQTD